MTMGEVAGSEAGHPAELVKEVVPDVLAGERLDRFVAIRGGLTRTEATTAVAEGRVSLNGSPAAKGSRKLVAGDSVAFSVPARVGAKQGPRPDPSVPVTVVYEDEHLLVVDKQAGLVVHAGAGHQDGTLVNGLLALYPELLGVIDERDPNGHMRPGIVHRLDGGTSGLLVVARTKPVRAALVGMLAEREVGREYAALVEGHMDSAAGMVDAPIGRSERDATRQAVTLDGRPAFTHYQVRERFDRPVALTLVDCELETGRTHQIRVHLAAIGHPVCGDSRYGATASVTESLGLGRPFLHAARLHLTHPVTGEECRWDSPLPPDLTQVLTMVRPADGQVGEELG